MTQEEIKRLNHKEMDDLQDKLFELIADNEKEKVLEFLGHFSVNEAFYLPTFDEEEEPLFNSVHCLEKGIHAYEKSGNFSMLESLLKFGLKIDDNDGFGNVLQYYLYSGGNDKKVIKFCLKKGAKFEALGKDGLNILHRLAHEQESEKLETAFRFGANLNSISKVKNASAQTPLHFAASSNKEPQGKALKALLKMGLDLNAKDSNGKTAFDIATPLCKELLSEVKARF